MRLFEKIRKRREEKAIIEAQRIEQDRLLQEQARQAEIERRKQEIEDLLNMPLPSKQNIVQMKISYSDKNGRFAYNLYDYFLCNVARKDMFYGDCYKARKITGKNIGDIYNIFVHSSPFSSSLTELQLYDSNGSFWEGDTEYDPYFSSGCRTIRDLNEYANKKNEERIIEYRKEKQQKQQNINDMRKYF